MLKMKTSNCTAKGRLAWRRHLMICLADALRLFINNFTYSPREKM